MLRSIGKQSGESMESVVTPKKTKKAMVQTKDCGEILLALSHLEVPL